MPLLQSGSYMSQFCAFAHSFANSSLCLLPGSIVDVAQSCTCGPQVQGLLGLDDVCHAALLEVSERPRRQHNTRMYTG